jgi:DeoR/GlpR family transcriptional regulator of sugar metabolism
MFAELRLQKISAELLSRGSVRTAELASQLGVSAMTVRRDLAELDRRGAAIRVHGGAVVRRDAPAPRRPSAPDSPPEQDEAMAAAAAAMVRPRMVIGMCGGEVMYALARRLATIPALTVVTNSLRVAEILRSRAAQPEGKRAVVILTGGQDDGSGMLAGPVADLVLRTIRAQVAFVDCAGLDRVAGATAAGVLAASVRRGLVRTARERVILAGHQACGVAGLSAFAAFSEIDTVITTRVAGALTDAQQRVLCACRHAEIVDVTGADRAGVPAALAGGQPG